MLRPETERLISFVPNMKDAFFFFKGEASNSSMTRAAEQACRVGACLVFAQRELLTLTGQADVVRPDDRTYVYSATMDSSHIYIWVHFAFVDVFKDGTKDIKFYMEYIFSKTFHKDDALLRLRGVYHNILDWGVGPRKRMLEKRYENIIAYDKRLGTEESGGGCR